MSEPRRDGRAGDPDRDRETVRLLRREDPRGLQRLLEDTAGPVTWWLRREFARALDASDIDEALAMGAHRAWRSSHGFDSDKGTLRAWFYVICRNCALALIARDRRQRPFVQLADWEAVPSPSADAATGATADEDRRAGVSSRLARDFRALLARLPRLQRTVIEADLAAASGTADARTLASQLGTSTNSIYNSRSTARKILRRELLALGHLVPQDSDA